MPIDPVTSKIKKALIKADKKNLAEVLYDAHTIWSVKAFTDLGFPPRYVKEFVHQYKSDGTPKGSIFADDGSIIKKLEGISSHRIVSDVAHRFDLQDAIQESYRKMGRGSSLAVITDAVLKYVEEVKA